MHCYICKQKMKCAVALRRHRRRAHKGVPYPKQDALLLSQDNESILSGMTSPRVVAILPAAGTGTRMQIPVPKQFCLIQNRPIISHTIKAFESASLIHHIFVVVSQDGMKDMEEILSQYNHDINHITLVKGGETRHRSIRNGVFAAEKLSPDIALIHDGVRMFVPESVINDVVYAAHNHGAAGAVRSLVSTVVKSDSNGFLEESLDRSKYRNSEMPQAFKYDVIKKAYEICSDYDLDYGTECLHLVLKYCNVYAQLIDGPDCLWKITHSRDLHTAQGALKDTNHEISVDVKTQDNFIYSLLERLQNQSDLKINESINSKHSACCHLSIIDDDCLSLPSNNHHDDLEVEIFLLLQPRCKETVDIFETLVQQNAKEIRSCLYGLVIKQKSETAIPVIISLLSSLFTDRNKIFSGQTFKV